MITIRFIHAINLMEVFRDCRPSVDAPFGRPGEAATWQYHDVRLGYASVSRHLLVDGSNNNRPNVLGSGRVRFYAFGEFLDEQIVSQFYTTMAVYHFKCTYHQCQRLLVHVPGNKSSANELVRSECTLQGPRVNVNSGRESDEVVRTTREAPDIVFFRGIWMRRPQISGRVLWCALFSSSLQRHAHTGMMRCGTYSAILGGTRRQSEDEFVKGSVPSIDEFSGLGVLETNSRVNHVQGNISVVLWVLLELSGA